MGNKLDAYRGIVRPTVQLMLALVICFLAVLAWFEFGTEELAFTIVGGVVGAGLTMLGNWQGERKAKQNGNGSTP